jgi:hypothetical protein
VLSTEHWSLLTTRSLAYSESFSRVEIFLALLTGSIVGLALVAQVDRYQHAFHIAAILLLSVVLFVGLATIGRLAQLNCEDMRCVVGMNRLRRGYLDLHPELEPYFLSASHDDLPGVMHTLNMDMAPGRWRLHDVTHGFQTLPTMLGVIVSVVAGVLAAVIVSALGGSIVLIPVTASVVFVAMALVLGILTRRAFDRFARTCEARFPSDSAEHMR